MIWSLVTLATIEAAAISATFASPFMRVFSLGCACTGFPSINTQPGSTPVFATADAIALRREALMPYRSISAAWTWAMPTALATSLMHSASFSRCCALRRFESLRPQTTGLRGSTTAATVRGPAKAPRPTSSTPTITPWPPRRS